MFNRSELTKRGYSKRILEVGVFEISEQRVAGLARMIRLNEWLSEVELGEIMREVGQEIHGEENVQNQDEVENENDMQGNVRVQAVIVHL